MHLPIASSNHSRVSVIIPAYNSSKFLPAAIESVLSQTCPAIEIVVVDDGSTDETKVVCDRYSTVKYIYQSNQGLPGARNTGIEFSQGEYLIFLDSDDCLLPAAIEIGLNCLSDKPKAGFVFGRYLFRAVNPDGSYHTQKLFDEPPAVASYLTLLAAQHNIQSATAICRREAIESVGRFGANLEDMNLFLSIARKFPIYFHDRVVSEYRYHSGNESSKSAKMLIATLNTRMLEWQHIQQLVAAKSLPPLVLSELELTIAYETGQATWIKFYGDRLLYEIVRLAQAGESLEALEKLRLVLNYDPQLQSIDREIYTAATEALYLQLTEVPIQFPLAEWRQELTDAIPTYRSVQPKTELLLLTAPASRRVYPQTQCIHQLFESQVERTPDAIAIVFKNQQLTYHELNDRRSEERRVGKEC